MYWLYNFMEHLSLCSETGNYDRIVIQELLKEIAQTQQVDLNAKQRFKGEGPSLICLYSCYSITDSRNHQRSRLAFSGCSGCAETNNGEIHVQHADNTVCQ